jgi:hypothetical protein
MFYTIGIHIRCQNFINLTKGNADRNDVLSLLLKLRTNEQTI